MEWINEESRPNSMENGGYFIEFDELFSCFFINADLAFNAPSSLLNFYLRVLIAPQLIRDRSLTIPI